MNGEMIATRQAYGEELQRIGALDNRVVVLDADLSSSTGTKKFAEAFPERFFNMGIAEQNMLSTAAGLALTGKIPFVSSFAMFAAGRAWEQIRNSIAHNEFNVKIAATHAGITLGQDGGSHQAIEDIGIMSVIPKMTVLVPADASETKVMIRAMLKHEGPCYIRLGRHPLPIIYDERELDENFQVGKISVLQEGKDVTIVAAGVMISKAISTAKILSNEGISAEIINLSCVKPLDEETLLKSLRKTRCLVSAEEHNAVCGINQILASLITRKLEEFCPMEIVAIDDKFGQSGKPDELLEVYGLTEKDICEKAKKVIARKTQA